MENEINLSKQGINSLYDTLLSGESDEVKEQKLKSTLTKEQMQHLNDIISDPDKIKAVLATPGAKKLLDILNSKRE